MGLLSSILLAPVNLPLSGSVWLGRKLSEVAATERDDPATLRAALREAEARLTDGTLSEADYDAIEADLLTRLRAAR